MWPAPLRGRLGLGEKGSGALKVMTYKIKTYFQAAGPSHPPSQSQGQSASHGFHDTPPETSSLLIQLPTSQGLLLSNRIRKNRVTAGV